MNIFLIFLENKFISVCFFFSNSNLNFHTGPFFFFDATVKSGQNKRSFKTKKNKSKQEKDKSFLLLMFEEVVQLMVVY